MIQFQVTAYKLTAELEGASKRVLDRFAEKLRPIAARMLDEARARATAHIHSVGARPGAYLAGFNAGVKQDATSVTGWLANSNGLAHLFEYGFTISDLMIRARGGAMKFQEGGVGALYRKAIHRHATAVPAYPAILPTFEAHKAQIEQAAREAAS